MSHPRSFVLRRLGITCVLALLACAPKTSPHPPPDPVQPFTAPDTPESTIDVEQLRTGLDAVLESYGEGWGPVFGYSGFVLVAQGDQILYQRGLGHADREAGTVPDIDTTFRVGSVTKQFTAAAILKLREQGSLDVTDPIRTYLPSFPSPAGDVTIHQLLTHTGGIWSYTSDPELMQTRHEPHTVDQMLAKFRDHPLDFEPGSDFRYSNSGYITLGAIIEAASGVPYGDFLRKELFEPAGMTRTTYGDQIGLDNRAGAYVRTPKETIEPAPPIDMSVPYAAGGIRSTARDLWAWHQALAGDELLSEESKALLYTPDKDDYAYGWVVQEHDDHPIVQHGGGIDGFITDYRRVLDDDVVIVAWSNVGPEAAAVGEAALILVLGRTPMIRTEPRPAPFDPAIVPQVQGVYAIDAPSRARLRTLGMPKEMIEDFERVTIEPDDQGLVFTPSGQPTTRIHPKADGTFFTKEVHGPTFEFDRPDAEQPAKGLWARQGPMELYYERVPDQGTSKAKSKAK